MSLVSSAGPLAVQTSVTSMSESGLIVLSVGATLLMGFLLLPPILAGRTPRRKFPAATPPWTGPVQGGVHLGDGRSVAPHRDAPAEAFDQEQVARAQAAQAEQGQGARGTVVRGDEDAEPDDTSQE
jgi:hypothetical protein